MKPDSVFKRGMRGVGPVKGLVWVWLLLASLRLCAGVPPGQRPLIGPIKGFKVPDYYPAQAGEARRLKSLLLGAEARPQPNGQIAIQGLGLEMYRPDGQTNLIAAAPECAFFEDSKTAVGQRQLEVHSGDGRITIAGEGFLWQETNTSLLISNDIRTVIHQDQPITINSQSLVYEGTSNRVTYLSQVRVQDPQMEMDSQRLTFLLPERGQPVDHVVAETGVVIVNPKEELRATGEWAEYRDLPELKVVELSGHPTWRRGLREGKADWLQVDRLHRTFAARGHTYTRLPRTDMEQPGSLLPAQYAPKVPLPATATPGEVRRSLAATGPILLGPYLPNRIPGATNFAGPGTAHIPGEIATNLFVEVWADESLLATNEVSFHGHVVVNDPSPAGPPVRMQSQNLRLQSAAESGQLEVMNLLDAVVIQQDESDVRSDQVVYTKANELAEFTGHPTWRNGPHHGQADYLQLQVKTKTLQARGHARMRLQVGAGQFALSLPATPANPPPATPSAVATNRYLLVQSDEQELLAGRAEFRGHVQAQDYVDEAPKGRLTCARMIVKLSAPGNRIESIQAEQDVEYVQGTVGVTNGPAAYQRLTCASMTITATNGQVVSLVGEEKVVLEKANYIAQGDKLTFDGATEIARLTGLPAVLTTTQGSIQDAVIFYDRRRDTLFGPSDYKVALRIKSAPQPKGRVAAPVRKKTRR